jgi:uncharacterized phage-associated protein
MKTALDTRYSTFEFIVHNLLTWYSSGGKPETDNDLSVLKVLKLLFFVSAVNANKDEHSILLEDIFSDYAAMPYGHVESRIYDYIKSNKGKLRYFSIDNHRTIRILDNDINNLREEIGTSIQNEVEQSITALKERNFSLIYYSAFA